MRSENQSGTMAEVTRHASVGVNNKEKSARGEEEAAETKTHPFIKASNCINPNMKIFDCAATILESKPLQEQHLPSGETMSYREFNKGQPHVLVVVPGFMTDDTIFSLLPELPQF